MNLFLALLGLFALFCVGIGAQSIQDSLIPSASSIQHQQNNVTQWMTIKGSKQLADNYRMDWEIDQAAGTIQFTGHLQSTSCWAGIGISPHRKWETKEFENQETGKMEKKGLAMAEAAITVVQYQCTESETPTGIANYFGKDHNTRPNPAAETYSELVGVPYRDQNGLHFTFKRKIDAVGKDNYKWGDQIQNVIWAYHDDAKNFGFHKENAGALQLNFFDPKWEPVLTQKTMFSKKTLSLLSGSLGMSYMWDTSRNVISFILETANPGWIGMGFNSLTNDDMDGAYFAVYLPSDADACTGNKFQNYQRTPGSGNGKPSPVSTTYTCGGYHYNAETKKYVMTFERPLVARTTDDYTLNMDENGENRLLLALGENAEFNIHIKRGKYLMSLNGGGGLSVAEVFEWLHAFAMIGAWCICISIANICGRFGRRMMGWRGFPKIIFWWLTHHILMASMALFLTFLGFIFILIRQGQFFSFWNLLQLDKPHAMMGFFIVLASFVQAVMGIISGALYGKNKKPSLFGKLHWIVGRTLWIMGFANVYLGMVLVNAHTFGFVMWYMGAAFLISLFVFNHISYGKEGQNGHADDESAENEYDESSRLIQQAA